MKFLSRQALISILFVFLGLSAWITVNGVWAETPLLVNVLPEGWKLISYIIVLIQLANLGPLCYYFIKRKFPKSEYYAIHLVMFVGIISCILLGTYWNKTVYLLGKQRSVYFFVFVYAFAFVDCTTSVLYIPYMRHFKNKYIFPFFAGEGLSGLVPSLLALVQGFSSESFKQNITESSFKNDNEYRDELARKQGEELNFPVSTYIYFLSITIMISWISYILLNLEFIVKDERIQSEVGEIMPINKGSSENVKVEEANSPVMMIATKKQIFRLTIMQAYICCLTNGVMSALQTYTAKPYGDLSYRVANSTALIANPVACLIGYFLERRFKIYYVYISMSIASCSAFYLIILALMSPHPFFVGSTFGSVLMIISWITFTGFFSFSKTMIASTLRKSEIENSLLKYGIFTQVGSTVGAIVIFCLINFTELFKSY